VRFGHARHAAVERLLWSRDSRLVSRIAQSVPHARIIPMADSGWCVIASAVDLSEALVARLSQTTVHGMSDVDPSLPSAERYVSALGRAVQNSGVGNKMVEDETPEMAMRKVLDYFFSLKEGHRVEFQPIVDLRTMQAHEWECLFRPHMPLNPHSIGSIVDAALEAKRPVDFDAFVVESTLERISQVSKGRQLGPRMRFNINLLPASLLSPHFEANAFDEKVRAVGLTPRQIVVECTEQQAVGDVPRLKKQVRALRRLGFGFAIDDAGSGYASFTIIAALEPSIIKIDREIIYRIGNKDSDAKKALVEAFVSFSRRIGAKVVAEGIENRRDLYALQEREVDFGQGYLLGRSAEVPRIPRRVEARGELPRVVAVAAGWDPKVPRPRIVSSR
jgi:EAL domain-containing protein (putative c-di-GMP-specific phosphodiesterase class I)